MFSVGIEKSFFSIIQIKAQNIHAYNHVGLLYIDGDGHDIRLSWPEALVLGDDDQAYFHHSEDITSKTL